MKLNQKLTLFLFVVCLALAVPVAKADYTNTLLTKWTFNNASNPLVSDDGQFTLVQTGTGANQTLTTNLDGTISLGSGCELVVAGINSATYPELTNNVTIWVKMRYDEAPAADVNAFGLVGGTSPGTPADFTFVQYHDSTANAETEYGYIGDSSVPANQFGISAGAMSFPGVGNYFDQAISFTAFTIPNVPPIVGYTDLYSSNGVLAASETTYTSVNQLAPFAALALGRLKTAAGAGMTIDEVRIYKEGLTPAQIASIGKTATGVPTIPHLVTRWTFDHGTVRDEMSDDDLFTFKELAWGSNPTNAFNVDGTMSLGGGMMLRCMDINSVVYPRMLTNVTVWARMRYDLSAGSATPRTFGLLPQTIPSAGGSQTSMVELHNGTAGEVCVGSVADSTTTNLFGAGSGFPATPAAGTFAYYGLVFQNTDPAHYNYQLNLNGTNNLSRSTPSNSPAIMQPFACLALGRLNQNAAVPLTFDEVRIYDTALSSNQIYAIDYNVVVAAPNTATTSWDTAVTVSPLSNDFDPNGLPLTLLSVSPTNGTASIVNGTNVLITPTLGSAGGVVTVGYSITNGNGGAASSLITVTVTPAPPKPVITSVSYTGGGIVMSGTNGTVNGTYQVLSSTNVTLPVASWTPISTNTFDSNGAFNVTNAVNPAVPTDFFLIKQ